MPDNQSDAGKSAADNIKELTQASKDLMQAGKQITDNLSELSNRAEHAAHLGEQIARNPWFLSVAAIAGGILVLALSRKRSA